MTTPAIQDGSPVRFCPVCRTADNHPRHDVFGTDPNVAPHMDCCAAQGCPDGSCDINVYIAAADKDVAGGHGQSPKGDDFRAWLVSKRVRDVVNPLLAARDEATRNFTLQDLNQSVHGAVTQTFIALQPAGSNQ